MNATPAECVAEVIERTIELAQIPSPTGAESARAARVAEWWSADGHAEVRLDEVGNVWARPSPPRPETASETARPALLLVAHLDTVFAANVDHRVHRRGNRLMGPGVGDNAVAVAALSAIGTMLGNCGAAHRVRLVATVAEEGLGNLLGITWALDHGPSSVSAVIALEGNYLGRIATTGIGSVRWRVDVSGPGGHSWEAPEAPSAVHEAAHLITQLAAVPVLAGRRTVNVGTVTGGEAINARSRTATFTVDLRADEPEGLGALVAESQAALRSPVPEGVRVSVNEIGRRPAGRISSGHPLVRAAFAALARSGVAARQVACSTDANAAHPRGIPGIALGITDGAAEHTVDEWIDLRPIAKGIESVVTTVSLWESESGDA